MPSLVSTLAARTIQLGALSVLVFATTPSRSVGAANDANSLDVPRTLGDYLQRAQDANPDLRAFAARYEAARERVPQAAALPDPTFQVTHFVESVQTRTGPQKNIFMFGQRVPWFGRLSGRKATANAEAEAIHFAFEARQLMLARQVGTAYYDYGYLGKTIELTAQNLALLERLAPMVEERTRTGASLNNLLRLRVEIGKLRDRLQTLQQKRTQLSAQLVALMALPTGDVLPWPQWEPSAIVGIDPSNRSALLAAVEAENPELLMLERKVASAAARVELARLETRPDFTIGLTYIQVGSPTVNPSTPDAGRDPWGITFAVNLPVWNSRTSSTRREASATRRASESELADRRNQLRADALASISILEDATRRVRLYQDDLLPLARQAVENTSSAYEGDRATLLELIDSERSQLDLELQLWRAHADAAQQRIALQSLANRPL
ncbi:MAG: TolC family protein [Opitutaceae bacterium]|nr:TolC family protein [Cephaloticoccus sp.]MCP5531000.1 TolC family protein [Opitutaceae bacterium]